MLHTALRAAAIGVLLHLAASAAPPKEIKIPVGGIAGGASLKLSVKEQPQEVLPPASNPYEGKAYAGCEGGYCPAEDAGVEREFFLAADKGKPKLVKKLLNNGKLNITRNIVPDSEGLTRVIDVAMWAASYRGHYEVVKVGAMMTGWNQASSSLKQQQPASPAIEQQCGQKAAHTVELLLVCEILNQ